MGIGGATARRLAQDGANIRLADVEDEAAASNLQRIRESGGTAESMHVDVGTADGVREMVERVIAVWGKLDIVVNNAYSGGLHGDAVALEEASWDRAMDVGLKSMF